MNEHPIIIAKEHTAVNNPLVIYWNNAIFVFRKIAILYRINKNTSIFIKILSYYCGSLILNEFAIFSKVG